MNDREFNYLNTIFERSEDGLMICDAQGRILKMNPASERLNGITASQMVGSDVQTLVREGKINRSATQEVLETLRRVSLIQTTPGSGVTLLVTGTPVFDVDNGISHVVVNEREISLIKDMKRELTQMRQESAKMRDELTELTLLELKNNHIVAQSGSMKQTLRLAMKLARIDASNILIQGESGTGKGLLAKFIHANSMWSKKAFIQINCAALPENLLEAELFGYERGAFTGARESGKAGLFELAAGGTLFLDEIGELSLGVQAKLLKYLDDHEVMPVGGTRAKKIECSIIAATNRNLDQRTLKHQFRLDLLHRLNTFTLSIPPLRERPEDILELTSICLKKYNRRYNRRAYIGYKAYEALRSYAFPGNVRELINIIKQAVVMCDRKFLDAYILRATEPVGSANPPQKAVDEVSSLPEKIRAAEYEMVMQAVLRCDTTREAANFLGISQPTVVRKLKKHGMTMGKKN